MTQDSTITLGDYFSRFVERQVEDGWYDSPSAVIRAGLRLLEQREARLADLRSALVEGEASGPAESFDIEAFLRDRPR